MTAQGRDNGGRGGIRDGRVGGGRSAVQGLQGGRR